MRMTKPDGQRIDELVFTKEGDKLMKEVLNGGYNVHPVPPPCLCLMH